MPGGINIRVDSMLGRFDAGWIQFLDGFHARVERCRVASMLGGFNTEWI